MRHYRVTLDDVIRAHSEALTYGGREGVVDLGLVESAIARPYSGYHRAMNAKCAALLHALVQNHGFVDGNKRTALIATRLFIERSKYGLVLGMDEAIDDVVVAIADGSMSFEELKVWFRTRLAKQ